MDFDLELLYKRIETIETATVVVTIDGNAGAGKTTVAEVLARRYDAPVVHMDHFFPQSHQRTADRLAQPGGNLDHERFATEVLPNLRTPSAFSYQVFDCVRMELAEFVEVPASKIILIEGSYSHHPHFGDYADLRVFLSIDPELQRQSVLHRGGPEKLKQFEERWIPLEEAYFAAYCIKEKADIILSRQ